MMSIPPPPGQLFDVGGYRMHLLCQGQGSPAVVMDSGLAGNCMLWANTLPAVAALTQACAFDRAGYAWSDPAPPDVPRTSLQIVAELRKALQAAQISPPYILLGHSFGAINMLVYAYTYPQEVAGLVLVDPSHPEMFERVPGVPPPKAMERSFRMLAGLGRMGLMRWLGPGLMRRLLPHGSRSLPPDAWHALLAFSSRAQDYHTARRESSYGLENFAQARGGPGSLGELPLEVLSAEWWITGKTTPMKQAVSILRPEQAALSTRGSHRYVSGCEHSDLPVLRPEAVAEAVQRIIDLHQQI